MPSAAIAWAFVLLACATTPILADYNDYSVKFFTSPRDPATPDVDPQVIRYLIRLPTNLRPNAPVFYGSSGRVDVTNLRDTYAFLDTQRSEFDDAIVVYVEQRFFGASNQGVDVKSVNDLATLTLPNTLQDHINLIQELSKIYQTKNFLVFGGGHGAIIASYLANEATKRPELQDFKILAWSSSPPLKYLYQNAAGLADYQEITKQFVEILKLPEVGCADADIGKIRLFFQNLRALADQTIATAFDLAPKPQVTVGTTSDDMKELLIFLRNSLLDMTYDNSLYYTDGGPNDGNKKGNNLELKQVCDHFRTYTVVNQLFVNTLLRQLSRGKPGPYLWKVTDDGSVPAPGTPKWNARMAAARYQDCTDLRILNCVRNSGDTSDPFQNTQVNPAQKCENKADYDIVIADECKILFRDPGFNPARQELPPADYPISLKKNVLMSMNKQSMFYKSFPQFAADKDEANNAYSWDLWGPDQWGDLIVPRTCDTAKSRDVRYLILRAFACFTGIVYNSDNMCTTSLLNDNKGGSEYDDTPPTAATCPVDPNAKFPFGHDDVVFRNLVGSTMEPISSATDPVTETPSGANTLSTSMSAILLSSLFVWFTACAILRD